MKLQNNQDVFLNTLRKTKTSVTLYLTTGVKLQGIVFGFDHFSILLKRDDHIQLVYKHSISTIMPNSDISFEFIEKENEINSN